MDNVGKEFRAERLQAGDNQLFYSAAGLGRRTVAFVLDLVFINIFLAAPFQTLLTSFFDTAGWNVVNIPAHIYASIFFISIVTLLYFALLQYYQQQTLGMMALGLYVMPRPSAWQSIVRNVFIIPFFPFNLLWIVEPAAIVFTGRRILERVTDTDTVVFNG
jgi:uncharacterized RDD family membrane protein YckC